MEAENKLRFELNKYYTHFSYSYGAMAQLDEYKNDYNVQLRAARYDSAGNKIAPAISVKGNSNINFIEFYYIKKFDLL